MLTHCSGCALRSGNEEKLMALLTPLNVNCHASDGRKVRLCLPRHPPRHTCHRTGQGMPICNKKQVYNISNNVCLMERKKHPLSVDESEI